MPLTLLLSSLFFRALDIHLPQVLGLDPQPYEEYDGTKYVLIFPLLRVSFTPLTFAIDFRASIGRPPRPRPRDLSIEPDAAPLPE